MVWPVQNDRTTAGRNRARKSGHTQDCESKRGRKPESLGQVQYSRDPGVTFFQKRPTARSGDWSYEQERSAQPAGSAGVKLSRSKVSAGWRVSEPSSLECMLQIGRTVRDSVALIWLSMRLA